MERRSNYRVRPNPDDGLVVQLGSGHGATRSSAVVDLCAGGTSTRFIGPNAPRLRAGERATLLFSRAKSSEKLAVEATVVAAQYLGSEQHYSFRFDNISPIDIQATSAFNRLFNRRGAYRGIDPDPQSPINVLMRSLDSDDHVEVNGRLRNISASGASVLTEHSVEQALQNIEWVELNFSLPEGDRALSLVADIRYRSSEDIAMCYGMRLDASRTTDFLEQEEEIVSYVMGRYDEKNLGGLH